MLRIGDFEVKISQLKAFLGWYFFLQVTDGNMQPVKRDMLVVQAAFKLVVNKRHPAKKEKNFQNCIATNKISNKIILTLKSLATH